VSKAWDWIKAEFNPNLSKTAHQPSTEGVNIRTVSILDRIERELEGIKNQLSDGLLGKKLYRILAILEIIYNSLELPRTTNAVIIFGANMAATPGTQAVGTKLTATFVPIEADGLTVTPGAVLSTQPTWSSSDTSIATVTANADGSAVVVGVAAGTATITGTGGVFTDLDGVATAPLTASNTDTVTQPTGRTVSAQVNFA
jgi:hypothetical protein